MELKPFTSQQNKKTYKWSSFNEMDVTINILSEIGKNHAQKGYFKFGLKSSEDEMFWFFNGAATLNDRVKMIEVFKQLLLYCRENNIGVPFVMKVQRFRTSAKKVTNN